MYSDTQLCVGKGWSTLLMMAGLVKGEPESPRSSLTCLSANCNDLQWPFHFLEVSPVFLSCKSPRQPEATVFVSVTTYQFHLFWIYMTTFLQYTFFIV